MCKKTASHRTAVEHSAVGERFRGQAKRLRMVQYDVEPQYF
jgi:hypothetical protein